MAVTAHEAGRNPKKSPDRVHIYTDYNRIKNPRYLLDVSPDYISSIP
jgi:hypothetical protein